MEGREIARKRMRREDERKGGKKKRKDVYVL